MEKYHTIIIGAGPAGLCCAELLASRGKNVLVLERNSVIGPKVCAGGIPLRAQQELGLPETIIQGSFPIQKVITPWQRAFISSNKPIIITVDRFEFGQWLLEKALRAGAKVETNKNVVGITANTVHTKTHSYTFDSLVGADGSSSIVRRYLNLSSDKIGVGINYQIPSSANAMEWHLDASLFKSGYAWVFPHRESTSIGIYAERTNLPPQMMKKCFSNWVETNSFDLKNVKPKAALVNFDYKGLKFKNIYLAGDAAGLASGFTGEGIYPAIVSGQAIAQTIMNPNFHCTRLNSILQQHKRHRQVQKFFTGSKVVCQITLEMIVLALRLKLVGFNRLEMY